MGERVKGWVWRGKSQHFGYPGFAFLVIFYLWPFLRAFWGLFFIFSRVLKQIQGMILVDIP